MQRKYVVFGISVVFIILISIIVYQQFRISDTVPVISSSSFQNNSNNSDENFASELESENSLSSEINDESVAQNGKIDINTTAAILFSSGSEGSPKGVELSHRNLASNARQIADALNTLDNDVIMCTLPTFHAFGLLASTLMPLSEGIPIVCHPDPTDAVNIGKGVARYEATLLFGTSTFLRLYAKNSRVHPMMFQSLRYIVAGAEKLAPEVRRLFLDRFGKKLLEGYGATETSPVASVNLPDQLDTRYWRVQVANREGTVGLPLPGTSFRIVDPDSLATLPVGTDGLILISGPQVMQGYLHNPEKTAQAIVELDGQRWYKTGDKGHLDEDGFLSIVTVVSNLAIQFGKPLIEPLQSLTTRTGTSNLILSIMD